MGTESRLNVRYREFLSSQEGAFLQPVLKLLHDIRPPHGILVYEVRGKKNQGFDSKNEPDSQGLGFRAFGFRVQRLPSPGQLRLSSRRRVPRGGKALRETPTPNKPNHNLYRGTGYASTYITAYTYIYIYTRVCICVCMYICIYICTYMKTSVYTCIHICTHGIAACHISFRIGSCCSKEDQCWSFPCFILWGFSDHGPFCGMGLW